MNDAISNHSSATYEEAVALCFKHLRHNEIFDEMSSDSDDDYDDDDNDDDDNDDDDSFADCQMYLPKTYNDNNNDDHHRHHKNKNLFDCEEDKESLEPDTSFISRRKFEDVYSLDEELGEGGWSIVYEGHHLKNNNIALRRSSFLNNKLPSFSPINGNNNNNDDGNNNNNRASSSSVAIKCVQRNVLSESEEQSLYNEVRILTKLNHPNIMHVKEFFSEPTMHYLVMERLYGDLFERIMVEKFYDEESAKSLTVNLLHAVDYMHSKNIVHRDLKPENILLVYPYNKNNTNTNTGNNGNTKNDNTTIKITDFNFASRIRDVSTGELLCKTQCGTPEYVAPEVLKCGSAGGSREKRCSYYDESVDMWSVGVIVYILLCGYAPFSGKSHDSSEKNCLGEYQFNGGRWNQVTDHAKDMISRMLVVDPKYRLTAPTALSQHPWIASHHNNYYCCKEKHNIKKLKKKLKSAIKTVVAVNKFETLGKGIGSEIKTLTSKLTSMNISFSASRTKPLKNTAQAPSA